jgi:hypothetical protein
MSRALWSSNDGGGGGRPEPWPPAGSAPGGAAPSGAAPPCAPPSFGAKVLQNGRAQVEDFYSVSRRAVEVGLMESRGGGGFAWPAAPWRAAAARQAACAPAPSGRLRG